MSNSGRYVARVMQGARMRVDGSLMGLSSDLGPMASGALLPEWVRGHFSLLFDGAARFRLR
jgi:hypothetical protein